MISEKDLKHIKEKFEKSTCDIKCKLNITDELPLLNYSENATFGTLKALNWAFKLGVKTERENRN